MNSRYTFLLGLLALSQPAFTQLLPTVVDRGLETRLQDNHGRQFGGFHHKRGRANICADFNNDGFVDIYLGNPGDESFFLINDGKVRKNGYTRFWSLAPPLLNGDLAWGAAAADYDDDGDIDLFISIGGNEGVGFDFLFQNMLLETGHLNFEDVTAQAGVAGPNAFGSPQATPSANAVWVDYDRDGDLDLWVNTNDVRSVHPNVLWKNLLRETGSAVFSEVTALVGIETEKNYRTLHSSWADFDQDGDLDLFENNFRSPNRFWKNQLVETGNEFFFEATAEVSLPGEDLSFPINSFGSAAIDFNSDGYEDILCVYRLRSSPGAEPVESPYGNGHAVFINDRTGRFSNLANSTVKPKWPALGGVMGFMVGDLNGDTFPELILGNGGPALPQANTFLISNGTLDASGFPNYFDGSSTIDFDVPKYFKAPPNYYQPYPYRTHGITFVDTNKDGELEIYVSNGGMQSWQNEVQEPNRHYCMNWQNKGFFVVRLCGDGDHVNRDGIGARLRLSVSNQGGPIKTIHRTNLAGTAFSAQNDIRQIHFALGNADTIHELQIVWSDGTVQTVIENLEVNRFESYHYPGS